MANTPQDDRFYKPATLWKWFGISSVLMMIFTLWMLMDDFGRDWKAYQREFFSLRQKKYDEQLKQAETQTDPAKLKELEGQLAEKIKGLSAQEKQIEKLENEVTKLKTKVKNLTVKFQADKGVWDVEKYEYEAKYGHKIAEGIIQELPPKGKKQLEALQKHLAEVQKKQNAANQATQELEAKQAELDALYVGKKQVEKDLKTARTEVDRIKDAKQATDLTLGRLLRSAPIVDMANPTFRLQQIVLPDIRDDIFFAKVQKVDRCTTCHMAIDLPGFENEKQPFRTHPSLDVMLGSRSPHPIDQIGCTVCHEGRGQATEFTRTAHTPRNHEQEKEWKKKYGWHEMHHVIEKMVPLQYTEGKCRVCHKGTEYVPKAEKLTAAYQTIRNAGCYGCHRIEGWDHIRKPAPSLKRVKGKLSRDWVAKWVKNPKSYNEYARMPAQFFQSNITTEQFKSYQEAEAQAITDWVMANSDSYTPNVRLGAGNAEKGKELFGSVGCLGCHQIDDYGHEENQRYGFAPELSKVGSKVSAEWLQTWLTNPKHYWDETSMPSLRLSQQEVADISSYLLTKRNPEFEQAEAGKSDVEVQKKVLRLYLMRDPKLAPVTSEKVDAVIAKMQPHEVTQKLGYNAIQRYGCFGCHQMKGFETTQGPCVELSDWGSKPTNKLDFGLLHMDHSNVAWFQQKMKNTREFDKGVVKEYLDLLKMPKYDFADREVELLTTAILGFTAQKITPPAAKKLAAWEEQYEETSRLIHKYNCQGCHMVENIWAPLPDDHPGKEEHDKLRLRTEWRILKHYSEDEALGPPPLLTEGERVKTPWLYSFLQNPGEYKIRYKLKVRMPSYQFSNAELNTIVTGWAAKGHVEFPYLSNDRVSLSPSEMRSAETMFNKLQCTNCHTVGRNPTPEEMESGSKGLAPNLAIAYQRLHRAWIEKMLAEPTKMVPGTGMPAFWPDNTSPFPDILEGNAKKQIELLSRYVYYLGQSRGGAIPNATPVKASPQPTAGE